MKLKSQRRIQFGLPSKVEGFLIGGMIFLLFMVDIIQNEIQNFGLGYYVTFATAGHLIKAIDLFWIGILLFTIFAVFVFSRSIWEGRTDRKIDIFFGGLMFVGLVLLIAGAIGAFNFQPAQGVPWFYGLPQITIYHIGMLMEIIAGLYFAITK
jgi:hypothetical protein